MILQSIVIQNSDIKVLWKNMKEYMYWRKSIFFTVKLIKNILVIIAFHNSVSKVHFKCMKCHTLLKDHICTCKVCHKGFNKKCSLNRNEMIHTSEKLYIFWRNLQSCRHLKVHQLSHKTFSTVSARMWIFSSKYVFFHVLSLHFDI